MFFVADQNVLACVCLCRREPLGARRFVGKSVSARIVGSSERLGAWDVIRYNRRSSEKARRSSKTIEDIF